MRIPRFVTLSKLMQHNDTHSKHTYQQHRYKPYGNQKQTPQQKHHQLKSGTYRTQHQHTTSRAYFDATTKQNKTGTEQQ